MLSSTTERWRTRRGCAGLILASVLIPGPSQAPFSYPARQLSRCTKVAPVHRDTLIFARPQRHAYTVATRIL